MTFEDAVLSLRNHAELFDCPECGSAVAYLSDMRDELAHMREACRLLRAADVREGVPFGRDADLGAYHRWLDADNPDAAEDEWNKANNGGMPTT